MYRQCLWYWELWQWVFQSYVYSTKIKAYKNQFQLKEHGQYGTIGMLAQGLATQTPEFVQCFTMEICLAQEPQVKQETVKVRTSKFMAQTHYWSWDNSKIFLISVEGVWTSWDNWGSCSGTCNTNTRIRTRHHNGNMPCTETSSEAGNCQSEDPASCSVHDLVSTVCTL